MLRIDPENWDEWKAHPITAAMFCAFLVWAADEQPSGITPEKIEEAHDKGR